MRHGWVNKRGKKYWSVCFMLFAFHLISFPKTIPIYVFLSCRTCDGSRARKSSQQSEESISVSENGVEVGTKSKYIVKPCIISLSNETHHNQQNHRTNHSIGIARIHHHVYLPVFSLAFVADFGKYIIQNAPLRNSQVVDAGEDEHPSPSHVKKHIRTLQT